MTKASDELLIDAPVGFWLRLAYILGPFALTWLAFLVTYLFVSPKTAYELAAAGAVSLLGAGTTVVLGKAAIGENLFTFTLSTWDLAILVMYINAASGFFYAYNLDLMQKVPVLGPALKRARRNAVIMLRQRPWIRKFAVVGVGLFVITPLPGSGSLGGCIVGRIIGVSKRASFMAVTIAGVSVCYLYATLANQVQSVLDRLESYFPPWVRLVVAALIIFVFVWMMAKLVRWFATHEPVPEPETEGVARGKGTPAQRASE